MGTYYLDYNRSGSFFKGRNEFEKFINKNVTSSLEGEEILMNKIFDEILDTQINKV